MDTARYIVASLIVATLPPALIFWYVVHPFARFWRTKGPGVTYGVVGAVFLGLVVALWMIRGALIGTDMGFRSWVLIPSVGLYLAAVSIEVQCRQYLTFKILLGLPEVAPERMESRLLDEGIYARMRHPRYTAIMLGTLGWAIFSGYTGALFVALATIPGLYAVSWFEEQELVERFGEAYEAYRAKTPRFVPRLRLGGAS